MAEQAALEHNDCDNEECQERDARLAELEAWRRLVIGGAPSAPTAA